MLASKPMAAGQMFVALDFYLGPVREFAVVGDPVAEDTRHVLRGIRRDFRPNAVVALKTATDTEAEQWIALLAAKPARGSVTTYICENFTCLAPIVGAKAFETAMQKPE